jgi:hypothetical protein
MKAIDIDCPNGCAPAGEPNVKSKWIYVWLVDNVGQLTRPT